MSESLAYMWAVVFPDGHIVTGSDFKTEADAWRIALGWPVQEEIDAAMKRGVFAVKAQLRYSSPNPVSLGMLDLEHDGDGDRE